MSRSASTECVAPLQAKAGKIECDKVSDGVLERRPLDRPRASPKTSPRRRRVMIAAAPSRRSRCSC